MTQDHVQEPKDRPGPGVFEKHPRATLSVILIVAFVAVVAGVEAFLARTDPPSGMSPVVRQIRLRENPPHSVRHLVRDEEHGASGQEEVRLKIDAEGFVYPSRLHDPADFSVVFLGGSTTQCGYVAEDKRFPYVVGRLLETSTRSVNSFNSGVSGNDSMHSINLLLNKVVAMRPDVVVMMHNINDLAILLYEGSYWSSNWSRSQLITINEPRQTFRGVAKDLKDLLIPHLYARVRNLTLRMNTGRTGQEQIDEWGHVRGKRVTVEPDVLSEQFRANLTTFTAICRAHGVVPVLMTQPNRLTANPDEQVEALIAGLEADFGIEYADYQRAYARFNETIRQVGHSENVEVIDLDEAVPKKREYIYDGVHLTDRGSTHVAGIIAQRLERLGSRAPTDRAE